MLLPPVDSKYTGSWGHYPSGGVHKAVDYPVPVGTPVRAPDSGEVTTAGWSTTGFGRHVRIRMDQTGDTAMLCHGSVLHVRAGARVARGDIVMLSGNTGSMLPNGKWSTSGPHLHFEVRHSSWNPATSFDFTGSLGTAIASLVGAPDPRRPVVTVANVRPGQRNADVRIFNRLLWDAQGPNYKAKHAVAWLREKGDLFGPVAQQVTYDTYAWLHMLNPAKWGPPPSKPAWPGKELVSFLGGDPR